MQSLVILLSSAPQSQIKTFLGLARASTKTVVGTALASVKSWVGISN